ncbi:MAG: hypothetical protein RIS94_1497 [Pseudomonadota bacterium]|jgi:SAM-dependent methyltransferase
MTAKTASRRSPRATPAVPAPAGGDPLADVVSAQYEQWVYPQPIVDLPGWLENNWQWFDPAHAHPLFWPAADYRPDMDILIAGCGTNQAAVIAHTNPGARIVAIDISQTSLDHHRWLKDRYALDNLELHRLPIEDAAALGRTFDLILSTGVLHHMASPEQGARALASCLAPDGVMALMLYARYGRIGVEILQSVYRDLGLGRDAPSLGLVRESLGALPPDHPIHPYMNVAPDLQYDAGLIDTFLHGRDRSFTIDDCRALVEGVGLVFQDLFFKAPYYPHGPAGSAFATALSALPEARQWSIMERVNTRNACHFFIACHADRPKADYRIDFAAPDAASLVPMLRHRCRHEGNRLMRQDWAMPLDAIQHALVTQMDSQRSIAQIAAAARAAGALPMLPPADFERTACNIFQSLWCLDIVTMRIARE